MKLTSNDIRQLIKEELDKLLKENLFRTNLEIINQQIEREPQAWKQEAEQYIQMLSYKRYFEDFYIAIYNELPMLAHILDQRDKVNHVGQRFLGSIANIEDSGQAGQLVEDYVNIQIAMIRLQMHFNSVNRQSDNHEEMPNLYNRIMSVLRSDPIVLGYFGVERVNGCGIYTEEYEYESLRGTVACWTSNFDQIQEGVEYHITLTMEKDNLQKNIETVRDLWHGGSYQKSREMSSTMVSPVPGNSNMKKYSRIEEIQSYSTRLGGSEGRTQLTLGVSEKA